MHVKKPPMDDMTTPCAAKEELLDHHWPPEDDSGTAGAGRAGDLWAFSLSFPL